tara:strand:+ start:12741 stop:13061 length:321 start_codon:yes stop_codon:yes gene_type:complete
VESEGIAPLGVRVPFACARDPPNTTIVTLDADPISPTFSVKSLSISPNHDGNQTGILWWRFGNLLHMDTRSLDLLDKKENIVIGVSQSSSEGLPVAQTPRSMVFGG